jgi:hypothetical protein
MADSKKGYVLEKNAIVIQRDLTELDLFAKKFLDILKKHTDYLVVSGFVSICTGRTRGTEDIDVIVPAMEKEKFITLFKELDKNNFWCYQGDDPGNIYVYIENLNSLRFAKTNEIFPNIELIPFDQTKKAKFFEFNNPQKIKIKDFEFKIPPLEFEILYKEIVLKGKKDIEDAKHLRTFFSEIIKEKNFKEYEPIIKEEAK